MVGTSFIDSFIKNTEFISVNGRYLNMSGAKISNIKIEESDFSESSFIEVNIKNLSLYGVNFTKAEFLKSLMDGVDFSSSNITDVMFDIYSVKGIVIDRFQCYELMGMLGVNVK